VRRNSIILVDCNPSSLQAIWTSRKHPFPLKNCTKEPADEFCLESANQVMHSPEALIVGSISTTELDSNPHDSVPDKFKKWTYIMSKVAAKHLPEHTSYNHAIDLKIRKTPS
jgi:hypothetical protein